MREDLLSVFDGDISMVDDITTMAIYPLLSGKSYNMLSSWQAYHHTASSHALEPSYITKLTQKIIDGNRMDLSRLRIKRQSPGTYGCIDSATRSGYIRPTHIANVRRYGDNKDGIDLPCTSDVVVYSLETHEPVYYRSFPESQLDMATVRTILTELNLFGICNVVMMTCRGYCSVANIGSFLAEGIPFLTAAKVQQMPVFPCLSRVEYDKNGLPSNMNYDPETKLYVLQVGAEPFMVPLPEGRTVKAENVKVNLYLDVERRAKELNMFKLDIQTEEQKINMIKSGERAMPDTVAFNKEFKWFIAMKPKKGGHDQAGNPKHTAMPEILEHVKAREKAERIAGFFASVQWGLENTAEKSLHDDRLRDEQEKYFYEFKDVYHADMQDCWTEGSRTGRDFICFVGLMIYSWVKHVWSTAGLKEDYRSTELLLDSMAPIHFSSYPNGITHMENFNNRQITLCGKFKITPPSECMTEAQKEDWQRAYPPKGARMT